MRKKPGVNSDEKAVEAFIKGAKAESSKLESTEKRGRGKPKGEKKVPIPIYLPEDMAELVRDEASKIGTITKIGENLFKDWLIERGRLDSDGNIIE